MNHTGTWSWGSERHAARKALTAPTLPSALLGYVGRRPQHVTRPSRCGPVEVVERGSVGLARDDGQRGTPAAAGVEVGSRRLHHQHLGAEGTYGFDLAAQHPAVPRDAR